MREIKFRAWNAHTKEMYPLSQITFPGGGTWSVDKGKGVSLEYQPHILIMQFTGLHDKNGKEIYEGDIVKTAFICEVIYDGKWMLKDIGEKGFYFELSNWEKGIKPSEIEIIGNIYENPELLK